MDISYICTTFMGVMQYVFYILIALLVLMVMITIHEFGHFIVGKKLGFKINEFAIGFGKILYKHTTKDGILVSLRLFPLGGYCAFEGEDDNSSVKGAFNTMAPWKRIMVLFSGAFFNFLSAVIMSFVLLMSLGYADLVQVSNIDNMSSITNASELKKGDIIYEVNDQRTDFVHDKYFVTMIQSYLPGEDIKLKVKRDDNMIDIIIQKGRTLNNEDIDSNTKKYIIDKDSYFFVKKVNENIEIKDMSGKLIEFEEKDLNKNKFLKFQYGNESYLYNIETQKAYTNNLGFYIENYKYSFLEALIYCVPFTFEWAWKVLMILWMLISGQLGLEGLGGPITTISSIATFTQNSWLNLLVLFPLISVNLAVFNWLPFPALDGARICFVVWEWIFRKPVNRKVESYIHGIGLIVLFAFVIFVDVFNLLF